jgi:hypothetical protein
MRYVAGTRDRVMQRGAEMSDCGTYRYRLWREWDRVLPVIAFLMLNPSTADDQVDDPTITRCLARAVKGGYGRLDVVNLFALRASDPDVLLTHADPLGPGSHAVTSVLEATGRASTVICAWGAHPAAAPRAVDVMHMLGVTGMDGKLCHLGLNKDGSPKHPLYVAASTHPKPFIFSRVPAAQKRI